MRKPRVYILVPGITTKTDDPGNWAPRFATEIMQEFAVNTRPLADEYRYFSGPLTRRFKQQQHASYIAELAMKLLRAAL